MSRCNIPHRKIRLRLDPFSIILPEIASRYKLPGQRDNDECAQQELDQAPEPNLDFRCRVRFLRPSILPSSEPFVSLALTCSPFLVFLLLLVPVLLVPVHINERSSDHRYWEEGGIPSGVDIRTETRERTEDSTHARNGRLAL